ncbi:GNAT family N-acetyltransferase [bacterium I07]|nr:GNAT family N-acetyltransferase [bacterium I07]
MAIEIVPYTQDLHNAWERFVVGANNGTLFHTRKFLSYHPLDRFHDSSLLFKDGANIIAVFPAAVRELDGVKVLASHCGASYGGFVCTEDLSVSQSFELVESLDRFARERDIKRVEMTLPPIIYMKRPTHYIDFALYKQGYKYKKREVSSVIPLDFPEQAITGHFKPEARTAYRKSVKLGITVSVTDRINDFYPILKKNLSMRHQVNPTHTEDEIVKLAKLFPERIMQWGAFLDDRMIAGVTNFLCNDRVVLAFYISHDEAYQKYRPVNHLFYEIIRWSIINGYKFLDFGIFTVNEDPNWGLGKFKESFGARGILRETFYKEIE